MIGNEGTAGDTGAAAPSTPSELVISVLPNCSDTFLVRPLVYFRWR